MDIHPSVIIWPKVKIGDNVKIWPDVVIKWKTIIGDWCELLEGIYINNSQIGDNTIIGIWRELFQIAHINNSRIGDNSIIGASARIDTSQIGSKCKINCKVKGSKIGDNIQLLSYWRIVKDSDIEEGTLHIC